MELNDYLLNLKNNLQSLVNQPFFSLFSKSNEKLYILPIYINEIIDDIDNMLSHSPTYFFQHYEAMSEQYYMYLNFYQEILETSSFFASNDILQMFTLNPTPSKYPIYFNIYSNIEDYEDFAIDLDIPFNKPTTKPTNNNSPQNYTNFNHPIFINPNSIEFLISQNLNEISQIIFDFVQQKKNNGQNIPPCANKILSNLDFLQNKKNNNEDFCIEDFFLLFSTIDKTKDMFLALDSESLISKNKKD